MGLCGTGFGNFTFPSLTLNFSLPELMSFRCFVSNQWNDCLRVIDYCHPHDPLLPPALLVPTRCHTAPHSQPRLAAMRHGSDNAKLPYERKMHHLLYRMSNIVVTTAPTHHTQSKLSGLSTHRNISPLTEDVTLPADRVNKLRKIECVLVLSAALPKEASLCV